MPRLTDEEGMGLALRQAARAHGRTAPNPPVGAVVVRDGVVIGRGATQPPGHSHAEVMALRDCLAGGHDPAGATMYVTLEPCNHHGRTPPCTEAILAAGVARVVVGIVDPTEPMCGRSLAYLESRGVEVALGIRAAEAERSMLGWVRSQREGLPEVTLKTATSMDGCVATSNGESQWITSPEARAAGRALRATHDAILVGIGTVLADDPRLTTRIDGLRDPVPVVLDTHLRLPPGCALDRPETLVFTGKTVPTGSRATVVPCPVADGRLDLERVLRELDRRGLHRVLVEGGPEVVRSLLDGGYVDTVVQFIAGRTIPGGRGWVGGPPLAALADAGRFELQSIERIGPDVQLTWFKEDACSQDS